MGMSGLGAGLGADMLQEILRQKFAEAFAQQKLAEDARQANQRNDVERGTLALGNRRTDQDAQQFDALAPTRAAQVSHLGAETESLNRAPAEAQKTRDFTSGEAQKGRDYNTGRDTAQHGYRMGEIGAQGANAVRVARINNQPVAGAPNPQAQAQANEVADSIALIDAIKQDPALASAVGFIDQGLGSQVGGALHGDPEGVTRFRGMTDQLLGKLALAQAGKLKGQGQISDKERALLAAAASALRYGTSEKDFTSQLDNIRGQFQRMQPGAPVAPGAAAPAAVEYDFVPGKGLVPRKGGQ